MSLITFNYLIAKGKPEEVRKLKSFIPILFKMEGMRIEVVNYIFCSDEYLLKINKKYLNHDYYTDIITFRLSGKGEPIVSDVFISVQRVAENAKDLKTPYQTELRRVLFHGALHLCKYNDKRRADWEIMRKMEDKYLSLFQSTFSRGTNQ
jgi:probable rRNA maturation factor